MQGFIYHFVANFPLSKTPRKFFKIQPVRGAIAAASKHSLVTNILDINSYS